MSRTSLVSISLVLASIALFGEREVARGQGYAPEEAVSRMTPAAKFAVSLVAAEPMIRQPVAIEFDDRSRLWVIQYLQYPNPAGLKRTQVDRYSRTSYDRVPDPPPRGPRGADRITILDHIGGDGRTDRAHDFVDGLNLASGIAFGHGGVYVLQVPYLLFYPDRNGDDVPDSDPDVLLKGFGMEDAHSVANSLTWGPDGWLYGCQGSTVSANIRGIQFQQGVWRYHPLTKKFELFCEGGGNSWGLDFDAPGNLFYSTNLSPYRMLHGVQGGYYWKSFGKHGALHNPYAYGYFEHVPYRDFQGGHVTVGGMIYQSDSFPAGFRGKYVAGDLLGHTVDWHDLETFGSSFRAARSDPLLIANDAWFAPTDLTIGPDGAVYVSDWTDRRTAHPDPDAEWDRSNGRVYRVQAKGAKPQAAPAFAHLSSDELVALLSSSNEWVVRKARRVLADRRDPEVVGRLRKMVIDSEDDHLALESLWALYVSGGFDDAFAERSLQHRNPDVRRWTVRLLGDDEKIAPAMAKRLAEMAASDGDVTVRSQLASTAKRLAAPDGVPIVTNILLRDLDGSEPHVPLLLWWAVERHAVESREVVLAQLTSPRMWNSGLARDAVLPRLMRRYAAEGTQAGLDSCAKLMSDAPSTELKHRLVAALDQGLAERPADLKRVVSSALAKQMAALWTDNTTDTTLICALARLSDPAARERAAVLAADHGAAVNVRAEMIAICGELDGSEAILAKLIDPGEPQAVQIAALDAVRSVDATEIVAVILKRLPAMSSEVRSRAVEVLLSRKNSANELLSLINQQKLPRETITLDQVRQVSLHNDPRLDAIVHKHWGSVKAATPEEKLAEVRRLNNDLRAASGDAAAGRAVFTNACATCHRLFNDGADVGPDLTHANRKDRDYLLISIIDPGAVVRAENMSYIVTTADKQAVTGLMAEQTAATVTLKNAGNKLTAIDRQKIKDIKESPLSLMPEGLLSKMKPQEVRDLFAYLQGDKP